MIDKEEIEKVLEKYRQRIEQELQTDTQQGPETEEGLSKEYLDFKQENLPNHFTLYEKLCNWSESLLKIAPGKDKAKLLQESIDICHLNITPTGAMSFSIIVPMLYMLIGALCSYALFIITTGKPSMFFVAFFMLSGIIIMIPLSTLPHFFANRWRMKSSNQMVLCIFYIVTYMRHTSNLENAIKFAAEHLGPPLSLDLKKVLWDVETEKYESIKESLDMYLETWRKYNIEFIESFHLVESSLYESSNERRLTLLDKSLEVILEETFEKMLHYAQNLQGPMTMLNMLGIILPILGLVILPLAVSFISGVSWYHISILYNVILPVSIYYIGITILSKRPTGYGSNDLTEENPELKKLKKIVIKIGKSEIKINPLSLSILIGAVLIFIGLSPIILHAINSNFEVDFGCLNEECEEGKKSSFLLLDYKESKPDASGNTTIIGPYGLGATILSVFAIFGVGISIGLYYTLKSKNVIKVREETKKLENEFASALFQLGNRLGDGIAAEMAIDKVNEVMEGTLSGKFFEIASMNIHSLGMNVEQSIFDKNKGALVYFPSNLIESAMKIFVQGIKKGPLIAAQAVLNVSKYIKEMHRVDERLKDLLSDTISSMKSQITFLAPTISGIVIGITSMITTIIGQLSREVSSAAGDAGAGTAGLTDMFGDGVPSFYFQLVVGIYVIQVVYILSIIVSGIENGNDKISEEYTIGKNMIISTVLYCAIALIITLIFNIIASSIMSATT